MNRKGKEGKGDEKIGEQGNRRRGEEKGKRRKKGKRNEEKRPVNFITKIYVHSNAFIYLHVRVQTACSGGLPTQHSS